jgi:hypothetical protein
MTKYFRFFPLLLLPLLLAACLGRSSSTVTITETPEERPQERDFEIVTLLPRDAIPAIDNPEFLSVVEADDEYALDELVIGVEFDGDARAYSIPHLSRHEIVNDIVGGRKIAVTW